MANEWNVPTAASEAKCLLPFARKYGVAAARALIAVSQRAEAELLAWADQNPLLVEHIDQMIEWRESVLREFDALIAAQQESKLAASPTPLQEQIAAPTSETTEERKPVVFLRKARPPRKSSRAWASNISWVNDG